MISCVCIYEELPLMGGLSLVGFFSYRPHKDTTVRQFYCCQTVKTLSFSKLSPLFYHVHIIKLVLTYWCDLWTKAEMHPLHSACLFWGGWWKWTKIPVTTTLRNMCCGFRSCLQYAFLWLWCLFTELSPGYFGFQHPVVCMCLLSNGIVYVWYVSVWMIVRYIWCLLKVCVHPPLCMCKFSSIYEPAFSARKGCYTNKQVFKINAIKFSMMQYIPKRQCFKDWLIK